MLAVSSCKLHGCCCCCWWWWSSSCSMFFFSWLHIHFVYVLMVLCLGMGTTSQFIFSTII